MRRQIVCAIVSAVLAVSAVGATAALATTKPSAATTTTQTELGKKLYRQFCGQCHALAAALAAGFGSGGKGLGKDGGPSFNDLRVPFSYSVAAVTEPTGGHELVAKKISYKQLTTVATYLAKATRGHPFPALPTDG